MNDVTKYQQPQHTTVPQYGFSDLMRMAEAMFKSGFYGYKNPEQVVSLMLQAQAEGLHPAIVARDYHLIENRPSLKADTMLARFQGAGGKVEWHTLNDTIADATFTAPGSQPLRLDWTIERAKTAGLVRSNRDGSPGMWQKYPRSMLRSRLVSESIRTVMPGVLSGSHTPEELTDEPELRDITPPRDRPAPKPKEEPIEVDTETGEILGTMPDDPLSPIDVDQPMDSAAPSPPPTHQQPPTQTASMSESEVQDHIAAMQAATTLAEVKTAHAKGYKRAHAVNDVHALARLATAKDAKKYQLAKDGAV